MAMRFNILLHQLQKLDSTNIVGIKRISEKLISIKFREMATIGTNANNDDDSLGRAPGLLKVLEGNPKRLKRIKFLGELFKTNGFELRIAGGAVRDMLRGKSPIDIDFATTSPPDRTEELVRKHEDLLRIIVTDAGKKHGTVAVKFKEIEIDFKRIKLSNESSEGSVASHQREEKATKEPEYDEESPFEITTLRCDKITDGRHAEVEFINDWKVDAERRDLTINALFLTLDDGKLIDYFGGESDLKAGIVRFVGDAEQRIKEDYLRILRYFRFWSRYSMGKQPDEDTLKKLASNLGGLNQISGERIWHEIRKTLSHLPCYDAFELMLRLRLFDYAGLKDENLNDYEAYKSKVLEEVKIAQDNIQNYLRDVLNPKLEANPQDSDAKELKELFLPTILFAASIQTDTLCLNAYKRLKFSNKERDTILYLIENKGKTPAFEAFKFQLAMSPGPERRALLQRMRAYLISNGKFDYIERLESWEVPQFPLKGKVVANAVRARRLPGDKTKQVLESIKLDWAKDGYKTDSATLEKLIEGKLDAIVEERDK